MISLSQKLRGDQPGVAGDTIPGWVPLEVSRTEAVQS